MKLHARQFRATLECVLSDLFNCRWDCDVLKFASTKGSRINFLYPLMKLHARQIGATPERVLSYLFNCQWDCDALKAASMKDSYQLEAARPPNLCNP